MCMRKKPVVDISSEFILISTLRNAFNKQESPSPRYAKAKSEKQKVRNEQEAELEPYLIRSVSQSFELELRSHILKCFSSVSASS